MSLFLNIVFFLAATVFSVMTLRTLLCLRSCHRLPKNLPVGKTPFVSVIFAACDEQDRVEGTVRHLFAQQHVEVEIIAVDDRSRDATGQILKTLSSEDPRLYPKRVDILPEDWLGKSHACHVGASSARGEWLLFTDADCWLKPDTIARALAVGQKENVEHVTLTPGVSPQTVPAEAWHIAFLMSAADWLHGVNQDQPKSHLGIGAFNLVRADTYRKFGGHLALRLSVVDDVKLGLLVRRSGGRTRAFIGGDDVECHWGVTVRQMMKIMEKNYFAAIDYRTFAGFFVGAVLPLVWLACLIGPFTGTILGYAAAAALLSCSVPALILARRLRWPIRGAILTPFVFVALFFAILNSTWTTLKQGGINWRKTFYPLDKLRAGNVE